MENIAPGQASDFGSLDALIYVSYDIPESQLKQQVKVPRET